MASISGLSSLAFAGQQLSPEEAAGLEVAIAKRRLEEDVQDVKFWGKISGQERDYLIAYAVIKAEEFPLKRFFAWCGNCLLLTKIAPYLSFSIQLHWHI
jgi:hypothetical protein